MKCPFPGPIAVAVALLLSLPAAGESPISEIIVFGDSDSDTGNVLELSQGAYVGEPYFGGRFSNGPVWVEDLAEHLGLGTSTELDPVPGPSLRGGTNYAFGGAQTGSGVNQTSCAMINGTRTCVWNLGLQVNTFLSDLAAAGSALDGDELFVVQGGSNNHGPRTAAIQLADHVATLAAAGGEYFLVPNLYQISQQPSEVYGDASWDNFVAIFNTTLSRQLDALEVAHPELHIVRMDWYAIHHDVITHPLDYGLSNVSEPACPDCTPVSNPAAAGSVVPHPEEYLYWDSVHFTASGKRIFGDYAYGQLQSALGLAATAGGTRIAAVPEPSSVLLLGSVLAMLGMRRRKGIGRL